MHHYKLCENVQSAHWADVCGAGATKVSTEEGAAFWIICEQRIYIHFTASSWPVLTCADLQYIPALRI